MGWTIAEEDKHGPIKYVSGPVHRTWVWIDKIDEEITTKTEWVSRFISVPREISDALYAAHDQRTGKTKSVEKLKKEDAHLRLVKSEAERAGDDDTAEICTWALERSPLARG